MARRGYAVTDDDLDTARRHLEAAPPITDAKHADNLAWLARLDSDAAAA
jgi:hypothetical protein